MQESAQTDARPHCMLTLPEILDLKAAAPLAAEFLALRGMPVHVDERRSLGLAAYVCKCFFRRPRRGTSMRIPSLSSVRPLISWRGSLGSAFPPQSSPARAESNDQNRTDRG
jgi:hypothetical protein